MRYGGVGGGGGGGGCGCGCGCGCECEQGRVVWSTVGRERESEVNGTDGNGKVKGGKGMKEAEEGRGKVKT